ncbi:glycerol-3-phosphate dehydrogenase [NAD(+)], cytoplasmic isoform X1 [Exaiptasia diaphana]|uniref:Glycerol-3-phosphate dehydrogenase [NAD(+)] n=1 Tax=Exaiptasia diaphana TaxID=2652724 RepID=A0A913Y9H1_EXADI|nr:glycerol-3-phosphate dehydrogenase [NAD(+)], cytoplasmic isoform X1 [Exaiptasia diaphana]KXJ19579.1 Glycerol-3-phosphate dehydrogenase [NAD(+)], cytoplasmic [Exaiptasia diaphana]
MAAAERKRVAIIGSGNWGSVIAKIVGANTKDHNDIFHEEVKMYVYEEEIDGKKLTEIINTQHENVKYLPGYKLPENVVAVPDVVDCTKDVDVLVFVVPHQFIKKTCEMMKGHVKKNVIAISLIKFGIPCLYMKLEATHAQITTWRQHRSDSITRTNILKRQRSIRGLDHTKTGLNLVSNVIRDALGLSEVSVLMGANLAGEVARELFGEATIGCRNQEHGQVLLDLFHTRYFKVKVVEDADTVELCGALKNAVAIGAGMVDALGYGDNTKAAIIRIGLKEMIDFANRFYDGVKVETFYESCGVADLITTCYAGRNRRAGEEFVRSKKTFDQVEQEVLGGQKLQGPHTAYEVYQVLKENNLTDDYPLFTAIYNVCFENHTPTEMMEMLMKHF